MDNVMAQLEWIIYKKCFRYAYRIEQIVFKTSQINNINKYMEDENTLVAYVLISLDK